jgi:transcriptional regulator with GAF, ATPase, and Fis domain
VLISGESGTGKELVASAIHQESRRKGNPFVPVSCGALPDSILESELFGHVRGAFTGAIRDKKGRFELADGGTLFLDEVGELPSSFQVKLLRVLQEMRFERVGGEKSISVDVRIIAASNRDIRRMVQDGHFREDLFYRLCVVPIVLPPLRERREDIPFIVERILERVREETGKPIDAVANDAMDLLLDYSWPGNIRELINALQFAAVRCSQEEILPRHLPPEVSRAIPAAPVADAAPTPAAPEPSSRRRTKLTREAVEEAIEAANGNKVQAAKILGVGRATLYRFLSSENDSRAGRAREG